MTEPLVLCASRRDPGVWCRRSAWRAKHITIAFVNDANAAALGEAMVALPWVCRRFVLVRWARRWYGSVVMNDTSLLQLWRGRRIESHVVEPKRNVDRHNDASVAWNSTLLLRVLSACAWRNAFPEALFLNVGTRPTGVPCLELTLRAIVRNLAIHKMCHYLGLAMARAGYG